MDQDDGVVVAFPGESKELPRPNGGIVVCLAHGEDTNSAFGLLELTVPPATGPDQPRLGVRSHRHDGEDEAWYILDGELTFTIGERTVHATAGTFLFVPRGVPHATVNSGARPARYLAWFTPPGMERYFEEHAALLAEAGGVPERAALDALGAKYGMRF